MKNDWQKMQNYEIHLELSSSCQASCPACSRIYDYNENIPNGKKHSNWDINSLHRVFNKSVLSRVREFLLCGNYGDPLAFSQLDLWISDVLHINESINFWIHTNGGIGTQDTWKNLGSFFQGSGSSINFSIDGLEDTNNIYRRGVQWRNVIQNAETYIKAGGSAIWKFIEFDHNKHQVEEARQLAKDLGFKKFKVIQPYSSQSSFENERKLEEIPLDSQKSFSDLENNKLIERVFNGLDTTAKEVSCFSLTERSIYVDCDKKLWPCCWMARTGDHRLRLEQREEFYRKVYDDYGLSSGFNSLEGKDLFSLLSHQFFTDYLPKSWTKESITSKKCLSVCLEKCSSAI